MTLRRSITSFVLLSSLTLGAGVLSGCAVATAGLSSNDERSFVGSLNDLNSGRAIEARIKRAYGFDLDSIDVEVAQGVVLLSGSAPTKEDRIEAARIAWSASKVEQVGNEILIEGSPNLIQSTKDGFLEKSVRARLTADKYVKGRNYNVETHNGIVYLLGVARDPVELERAARIAALTMGTQEVVSYVRVANPSPEFAVADASGQSTAGRRNLPNFVTDAPLPDDDSAPYPAPLRRAPMDEPIRRGVPNRSSQSAMGDVVIPNDPNAAPFYVDPQTGEQIPVRFRRSDP